jgi:TRAP-type C4-dicarboxylate transport system permease small subunit
MLDKLLFYFIGLALAGVVFICLMQVIARYAFNASFSWAEEVSITLVLWAVWVGASVAVKSNDHLRLAFLEKKFRPRTRLFLRVLLKSLTILFAVIITYASRVVLKVNENITLMSLPITVNVMYWSVPFGCSLMTYYCLRSILNDYKEFRSPCTEK